MTASKLWAVSRKAQSSIAMFTARSAGHGAARDQIGQVFAIEVLHRDQEVAGLVRQMLVARRERAG